MPVLLTVLAVLAAACGTESQPDSAANPSGSATQSSDESPIADPEEAVPAWYGDRSPLDSCGVDAEYTDEYPNVTARSCFRDAYEASEPAELTRVTYGDEGESIRAHFRVLGPGSYEIVGEWTPDSPAPRNWVIEGRWVRYSCDRFVFIDDPSAEGNGAPWVNAEGECTLIDQAAG